MSKITAILADDHDIVRYGISQLLTREGDIEIVAEAENGREAIEKAVEFKPDILIMDIRMPIMTGIEAMAEIQRRELDIKVLILSMYDVEEYVLNAVQLGALGYVLKDAKQDRFVKAVRTVAAGDHYYGHDISKVIIGKYLNTIGSENVAESSDEKILHKENVGTGALDLLSPREKQILSMIANGGANKQVADSLNLSVRTVETHRQNMMKKMGLSNFNELIKLAFQEGLVG